MRTKSIIVSLLIATIFAMAGTKNSVWINSQYGNTDTIASKDPALGDTLRGMMIDSASQDTTQMDSIELAIYKHNKAVDDSIKQDSVNKSKAGSINSPVNYSAKDSMVYDAKTKIAHLYGASTVKYENMDLKSEKIFYNFDKNTVLATGVLKDSASNKLTDTPEFKFGQDSYKSDTMAYNFKTKKGLIRNVNTQQEDGFLQSQYSKRDSTGSIFLAKGRYTTCDKPHPDFYIALTRAKVRPGNDVVFGPAYMVVADVPLPLAVPFGFFPFTKHYSSGFIMPSYGDERNRGFYLRNGGYYFAISDKIDLKVLGEIYTKGSWGISLASNYNKRYRFSGSFLFSFQDTKTGDKGMPDYNHQKSFKVQWNHHQDSKANPFSNFSASVNFATSSFERNNLTSLYNPQALTQSTRTSSVSYSRTFPNIGLSLSSSANLSQNMRDSTISITLPDLNISLSRFYPFKRKHAAGDERWYEKIAVSYTGRLSNSISTKNEQLAHSNIIKDWRNAFQHNIPINGNFSLFNVVNINPSFNFTDRMYSRKINRRWNELTQKVENDTTYGFHNVYNWNLSLGMSTKLYGFFIPDKKIFGDKVEVVRHVFTPSVSLSYAPDFGNRRYGYYDTYQKTDKDGNVSLVSYSPFQNSLYGVPGRGQTGSISFDISNNLEMKLKTDDDSIGSRKISLIDELGMSMSYNMAAKEHPWSDLSMRIRLKWWKNYTFNMNAVFATYAWELNEKGVPYIGNHTEWGYGRFGRFQGTSQNISYTLNAEKLKNLFKGKKNKNKNTDLEKENDQILDTDIESNVDKDMIEGQRAIRKDDSDDMADTDEDGYMKFKMPWSLTFGYGITMSENTQGEFNKKTMRYPYRFTQTLNISGNISISDGWNISFSSGYDFENKKISMTTASLQRDLHCFNMSANIVIAPFTSYNFTFRANASTLTDALKYDKRSGYSNSVQWY